MSVFDLLFIKGLLLRLLWKIKMLLCTLYFTMNIKMNYFKNEILNLDELNSICKYAVLFHQLILNKIILSLCIFISCPLNIIRKSRYFSLTRPLIYSHSLMYSLFHILSLLLIFSLIVN